jgi:predicted ribosomally synthesized peptide with nif11-like leader
MLKEFKARLESDEAFRAKFADVKTEDELLRLAKAEGYDLENLSEEELDMVAGGGLLDICNWINQNIGKPLVEFILGK